MKMIHALIPALLLSVSAGAVSAKVLASATRSANFTYNVSPTPVPLDNVGATSLTFNSGKAGTHVLTYSAECSADNGAATNAGWVEIDVEVNGVVVAPTVGSADSFCSPDNVAGTSGWVRPSITVPVTLVKGANTVRILGKLFSPVITGWLGDTSLVIHQ
ncbi:MAG: hypothetical protein KAZ63_06830 [Vitreoscilla sp.]|nr:hypothetical protein [Vitreoscilla sp.]